jgi:hypothetical protein
VEKEGLRYTFQSKVFRNQWGRVRKTLVCVSHRLDSEAVLQFTDLGEEEDFVYLLSNLHKLFVERSVSTLSDENFWPFLQHHRARALLPIPFGKTETQIEILETTAPF